MTLNRDIIEQYAAADEDQRLGLYLIHRHLREDFMEIDLAEPMETVPQETRPSANSWLDGFHKYCLGWLKLGRV